MKTLLASVVLLSLGAPLGAQITMAPASPHAQIEQQVGLATVTLDYSRPGVKGREVFGKLEPYGRVWRTGANASTKLGFDRDVQFGGEDVPAGTYALYTIPGEREWTLILSTNIELWGAGGYDAAQDLLRLTVPVTPLESLQETLTLDFTGFHDNGADFVLRWEHVELSVPVFVDSDAEVFRQIDEHVRNAEGEVSAQAYFAAGAFYFEKNRDLPQAAAWMEQAVEGAPHAFWMVYARAEVARAMGDDALALEWAERAHGMVADAPNDYGYLAKSQMLIDELKSAGRAGR